jgi:hypothetical protein
MTIHVTSVAFGVKRVSLEQHYYEARNQKNGELVSLLRSTKVSQLITPTQIC